MKVKPLFSLVLCLTAIFLTACSHAAFTNPGGGGGGPFTIGGTVTGLSGTGLTLTNGTDTLTITGNSAFAFKKTVASGGTYNVTVSQSPTSPNQTCTVSNGNGKATANVTNVTVTCSTGTVAIGVTVAGLSGTGLVLQNGTDFLTITGTTTTNQFKVAVPFGQTYNVLVSAQPTSPAQTCTVTGGSGTATDGVAVNVQVTCSLGTISIGGSVSGFAGGSGFVLQNNGGDNLSITKNGTFSFPILVPVNGPYKVTVFGQPSGPNQLCTVTNGTGTAAANVTTVSVVCPAVFHPIDVNVVGLLGTSGKMQLLNNGGDNLVVPKNGAYTFATPIAHGSPYDVTQFVASGTQANGCNEWGWSGLATSTPVNPIPLIDCGHNDWTWMAGSNQVDQYGTRQKATPPTCPPPPPFTPGGSQYSSTWTDKSNDLWLLTGIGFSSTEPPLSTQTGYFNELWMHKGTQAYWGGCGSSWQFVAPSGAVPPERWGAITWTDSTGKLMLFGGQDRFLEFLNDLWSYDTGTNTWTQIGGGPSPFNKPGVYGTQGTAAAGNWPGGRWGANGRLDASGNLWVFGGFGCDSTGPSCSNLLLNDLWKYSGGVWTWVKGSNTGNQAGVYGTKGTAAATNVPPSRQASTGWVDNLGNFWMFGGFTSGTNGFNDLWKYDPVANQWTWISGSPGATNTPGNYGTQGVAAASNVPGARWLSAAWSDTHGNLWLFGGQGYDVTGNGSLGDLWEYTIDTATDPGNPAKIALNQWTWIKGPNTVSQPGIYGVAPDPGVWPHVTNNPGTRWAPSYWTTKDPTVGWQFWMFGGEGFDATGSAGKGFSLLNDLWRYLPYP
ncbi:MAG TPA: kelch repeat-containing protein [Candidatus Dormibacteraeota bacterium]|nr:kelch repeat-containing protein [Candidatus Dormibacteraeota bacterium]